MSGKHLTRVHGLLSCHLLKQNLLILECRARCLILSQFRLKKRKSTIYVVLYGSIVGLGSVIPRYVSGLVHSMLQELGFGEEMFNPVATFLLLCVILTGAWLGY